MTLPFTESQFLDVFGDYNRAMWLPIVALWAITLVFSLWWLAARRVSGRPIWLLLAVHWLVSGIAYHWLFFRRINGAATIFGGLFVVQALIFAWLGLASRGRVAIDASVRSLAGAALVIYGLAYPFLGLAFGLKYPRMPLFAVPCPTTLVTAGFLTASAGVPRAASIIPIVWAFIGASAAFALGIRADLALVIAAVLLAIDLFRRR